MDKNDWNKAMPGYGRTTRKDKFFQDTLGVPGILWCITIFVATVLVSAWSSGRGNSSTETLELLSYWWAGLTMIAWHAAEITTRVTFKQYLGVVLMKFGGLSKYLAIWTFLFAGGFITGLAVNWNLFVVGMWLSIVFCGATVIFLLNPVSRILFGGSAGVVGLFTTLDSFFDRRIEQVKRNFVEELSKEDTESSE